MTAEQKARLETLKAKAESDLDASEKTEMSLLLTIEKQSKQIVEKDSLIGAKGTEIGELKKQIEAASGAGKEALQKLLDDKQEVLNTLKIGLDALKEANATNKAAADKISQAAGNRDTVDPKELEALETKAYADNKARAEAEAIYNGFSDDDKLAYRTDPKFKKMILEKVLGAGGDETDDSLWSAAVKKQKEGAPAETPEQRMRRLFDQNQQQHRRMPSPGSGRGGRGGLGAPAKPKPAERELDSRSR